MALCGREPAAIILNEVKDLCCLPQRLEQMPFHAIGNLG
jgi:hypothetical protein